MTYIYIPQKLQLELQTTRAELVPSTTFGLSKDLDLTNVFFIPILLLVQLSPSCCANMNSLCALRLPKGHSSLRESRSIDIIDCLQLPHTVVWHPIRTTDEAFEAIKAMKIRGAPAIASLAALAIACELMSILDNPQDPILMTGANLRAWLEDRSNYLLHSRPTAVNLREAMHRLVAIAAATEEPSDTVLRAQKVVNAAELVWIEDVDRNTKIGDNGATWLLQKLERAGAIKKEEKINVLTVCNTGSLATSVSVFICIFFAELKFGIRVTVPLLGLLRLYIEWSVWHMHFTRRRDHISKAHD